MSLGLKELGALWASDFEVLCEYHVHVHGKVAQARQPHKQHANHKREHLSAMFLNDAQALAQASCQSQTRTCQ